MLRQLSHLQKGGHPAQYVQVPENSQVIACKCIAPRWCADFLFVMSSTSRNHKTFHATCRQDVSHQQSTLATQSLHWPQQKSCLIWCRHKKLVKLVVHVSVVAELAWCMWAQPTQLPSVHSETIPTSCFFLQSEPWGLTWQDAMQLCLLWSLDFLALWTTKYIMFGNQACAIIVCTTT